MPIAVASENTAGPRSVAVRPWRCAERRSRPSSPGGLTVVSARLANVRLDRRLTGPHLPNSRLRAAARAGGRHGVHNGHDLHGG